jgi:hypothetical protein
MKEPLPDSIQPVDLLQMRLALAEEGRAQNAVVALEAQLELRRIELQQAMQRRASVGVGINEKYQLDAGDTYTQTDGKITRSLPFDPRLSSVL